MIAIITVCFDNAQFMTECYEKYEKLSTMLKLDSIFQLDEFLSIPFQAKDWGV